MNFRLHASFLQDFTFYVTPTHRTIYCGGSMNCQHFLAETIYSEVPNRRTDRNKRAGLEKSATLLAYLLSK